MAVPDYYKRSHITTNGRNHRLGYDVLARDLWATVEDYPTKDEQRLRVWIEQIYSYGDTMSLGIVTNGQADAEDL